MPAYIPVSNCTRSSLIYGWNGQNIVNTFHFTWDHTPPVDADRTALNTALHSFWTNHLKTYLSQDIALFQIVTVNLEASNAPQTTLVINPSESGSVVVQSLPNNVCIAVTTRTALRGRNYRGRVYVPGLERGSETDSVTYALARVNQILTAFTWLLDAANTAGAIWSVVSRYVNKAPRGSGIKTPITAVSADNYFDSQRRRLLGRGS